MADDRILFAIHDHTCFIKMLGEAKQVTDEYRKGMVVRAKE